MTRDILLFLLNAAWQALIFFVLGAIAAHTLRKAAAAVQYFLAVAVLIAASLAPWLSMLSLPNSEFLARHWVWQSRPVTAFGLWISGGSETPQLGSAASAGWHVVPLVVAWIYGLFVVIQLSRLIYGWLQVGWLVASSRACNDCRILRLASSLHREGAIGAQILVSNRAQVPFTIGVRKPVVVLPHFLLSHSDDVLALVLAHEFAHIRRRDWIVNLGLLLVSLPLSFHPCIALMRKKVEASREAACDELASGCMGSASDYARVLLDLAGKLAQRQPSLAAAYKGAALGVLDGSTLGDRIRRLMDRSPRLSLRRTRLMFCACMGVLMVALVTIASFALTAPPATTGGSAVGGIWAGQFIDQHPGAGLPKAVRTPVCLELQQDTSEISGSWGCKNVGPAFPIQAATLSDSHLRFTATPPKDGNVTVVWTFDLSVSGNQMSGVGHAVRNDGHKWDVDVKLTREP